ncbi:hypothetical protein BSKO_02326 [Bryopsis sp. KO-2023]|nr:hypothetical protein BSKO_02326 [Bryopsis sp. KO-2023]
MFDWGGNFDRKQRDRALGLFFAVCVSLIWVAASFLVQDLEEKKEGRVHPLIITYVANSLFLVYLPISKLRKWLFPAKRSNSRSQSKNPGENDTLFQGPNSISNGEEESETDPLFAAIMIAPFWCLAQLCFNLSLAMTSVSSNTILSSSSSLFTFLLSIWVFKEPFVIERLLSLLLCLAGVVLVMFADESSSAEQSSAVGDLLAIVAALFYAIYTILLKKMLPPDDKVDMTLFFGYMGLGISVILGCTVWSLHGMGVIDATITREALGKTIVKGLFDNVLSDYLWARAILLIGPTIATVALSLQVPFALIPEVMLKHPKWAMNSGSIFLMISGTVAVLAGFFDINMEVSMFTRCWRCYVK